MNPRQFLQLAQLIPDPTLLLARGGRILACSPAGIRAGLWPLQAVGNMLHELVSDPGDKVTAYLESCRRSGQPVLGVLTFRSTQKDCAGIRCRCDGAVVHHPGDTPGFIALRVRPLGEKEAISEFAGLTEPIRGQAREAPKKREITEELRVREARLSELVETTQDGCVFIDRQSRILRFNAAAQRMFGYSYEEAANQHVAILMAEPYASEHDEYIRRYRETGVARAIGRIREVSGRRKNGELFPIELSVTAITADGDNVRYAAFLRDISERKRMQEQLLERERLAAIGTTAANFAHEVGNPLNGMYMNAQLATRRLAKGDSEAVARSLDAILSETERLNQLLEEFRSLSKRQTFRFSPLDVPDLLTEISEQEEANYTACGVTIALELPGEPVRVQADRSKFKQVLLNLCKNAVEAMPDGGTLTMGVATSDRIVRLEVRDTGTGIPAGVDVFEPFTTTKTQGTGLGLAVVRQIIAAHDGTITYACPESGGTTFIVEMAELAD